MKKTIKPEQTMTCLLRSIVMWIAVCLSPLALADSQGNPASRVFGANTFTPPTEASGPGFRLVPLGPDLAQLDYDAYMSSIEHLQRTYTRSTAWPQSELSLEDAMAAMVRVQARFEKNESFAYAVLNEAGDVERGCVYVYPSGKAGFDAEIRLWVTQAEFDEGFDTTLYAWTQAWVASAWPFQKVAYPGRATSWASWEALPDA